MWGSQRAGSLQVTRPQNVPIHVSLKVSRIADEDKQDFSRVKKLEEEGLLNNLTVECSP